ncbi:hypothetical protein L207DRAFT_236956 [Hyaloscypha variabilis F]|uniref:Uncharacterized protein n=1 Tax=Hyaloscypha variabilis (strain UAMH 11265 / GT02V1 / F) TaxID=1149755 RepID=A0A2J6QTG0_HYAVF|nr:hypothetical protein L207DRAFT_236956 [Hyaloscypha variabilis F]
MLLFLIFSLLFNLNSVYRSEEVSSPMPPWFKFQPSSSNHQSTFRYHSLLSSIFPQHLHQTLPNIALLQLHCHYPDDLSLLSTSECFVILPSSCSLSTLRSID